MDQSAEKEFEYTRCNDEKIRQKSLNRKQQKLEEQAEKRNNIRRFRR